MECRDGGFCHHYCVHDCFREQFCVPLTCSNLNDPKGHLMPLHREFVIAHLNLYSKNLWVKEAERWFKLEDSINARREHFLMYSMGGEMGGI